jgi:hypothetical protein
MTKTIEYLRSRLRETATAVPTTSAICCDEGGVFSVVLFVVSYGIGDVDIVVDCEALLARKSNEIQRF